MRCLTTLPSVREVRNIQVDSRLPAAVAARGVEPVVCRGGASKWASRWRPPRLFVLGAHRRREEWTAEKVAERLAESPRWRAPLQSMVRSPGGPRWSRSARRPHRPRRRARRVQCRGPRPGLHAPPPRGGHRGAPGRRHGQRLGGHPHGGWTGSRRARKRGKSAEVCAAQWSPPFERRPGSSAGLSIRACSCGPTTTTSRSWSSVLESFMGIVGRIRRSGDKRARCSGLPGIMPAPWTCHERALELVVATGGASQRSLRGPE